MIKIDMLIAGAQKTGTSSLARYLGQHPDVEMHPSREFPYFVDDELYQLPFDKVFRDFYQVRHDPGKFICAKSVGVLDQPGVISRVYKHNPDMKLVVLLRDPVDRAYSAYWYARRMGFEDAPSFEEAIRRNDRIGTGSIYQRHCAYLQRGFYFDHLQKVFEFFPSDHLLIYLVEDLKSRVAEVCRDLYKALGADPSFSPDYSVRYNVSAESRSDTLSMLMTDTSRLKSCLRLLLPKKVRQKLKGTLRQLNERPFSPPEMLPETERFLREYFSEPNLKLEELLQRDLARWGTKVNE